MAKDKIIPVSQMKPKHAKQKMALADLVEWIDSHEQDFESWKKMVLETIKVQRQNLDRADNWMAMLDQVAHNQIADAIGNKQKSDTILWAFGFTRKVKDKIDATLFNVAAEFEKFDFHSVVQQGPKVMEEPILAMVPYMTKESKLEDVYWGDIVYQTIRPFGEKANDTARQIVSQWIGLEGDLDDDALAHYKQYEGTEDGVAVDNK